MNIISIQDAHPIAKFLSYFSSRWKVVRAVAWLLRVRHVLAHDDIPENKNGRLNIEEMRAGEREIVLFEQRINFGSELKTLQTANL